jgi:hypothetical protein
LNRLPGGAPPRAAELADLINAYDPSSAETWIQEAVAGHQPASFLNFLAMIRHDYGGIEVEDIAVHSPTVARVIFRSPLTGIWRACQLFGAGPPLHSW